MLARVPKDARSARRSSQSTTAWSATCCAGRTAHGMRGSHGPAGRRPSDSQGRRSTRIAVAAPWGARELLTSASTRAWPGRPCPTLVRRQKQQQELKELAGDRLRRTTVEAVTIQRHVDSTRLYGRDPLT